MFSLKSSIICSFPISSSKQLSKLPFNFVKRSFYSNFQRQQKNQLMYNFIMSKFISANLKQQTLIPLNFDALTFPSRLTKLIYCWKKRNSTGLNLNTSILFETKSIIIYGSLSISISTLLEINKKKSLY